VKQDWKFKLGLGLVILSVLFFLFLPFIPLLHIEAKDKILLSTFVFVLAEVLFWTGGLLLGRQLFNKYKSYLNPKNWFNSKKSNGV